ncbi:MAG TPA: uracil-DNA glycosylase [Armatimonadota bacterium]|jgi:uracil-DNA glycosylase family 4
MTSTDATMQDLLGCRRCPRLAAFRGNLPAAPATHRDCAGGYWAKPVPGFGDPEAEVLLIGLAPGFHGANRTGRPFTGDYAGDFMYRCLYDMGFANLPESLARGDGFTLRNLYITNAVKCVPPENKPTPQEVAQCAPYLAAEIAALPRLKYVIALGKIAHDAFVRYLKSQGHAVRLADYPFAHGLHHHIPGYTPLLVDSYHTSRLNLNTRRMTRERFIAIFAALGLSVSPDAR